VSVGHTLGARLRERRRWGALGLLVPVYALGVLFLREPVLDPLTLAAFVIDRTLQVGVLAVLGAAPLVLLGPPRLAAVAAAGGALVGFGMSASVLGAGLRAPRDLLVLALAVVALIGSLVLARGLWPHLPAVGAERRPVAVLLGALAAGALPLLQLWNSSTFTTLRQNVSLSLAPEVTLQQGPTADEQTRVRVAVTATNEGSVRAIVIISDVDVCWWGADEEPVYDTELLQDAANCTSWGPITSHSWIDAGAALENSRALGVPASSPRVVVIARAAYARGDRLALVRRSEQKIGTLGSCTDVRRWTIREEARFRGLAQQQKYVLFGDDGEGGGVDYYVTSEPDPTCPDDSLELADYYGVTHVSVTWETWLAPEDGAPPTEADA
jgi:hypothetical protein